MNRYDVLNSSCEFDLNMFGVENFNFVQPNIVDPLCVDVHTDSDGNVVSYSISSDINLLFNQERLSNVLGRDGLKKFFDDMSSRSSALTELRSKISDDDLAAMCKSRYLQSPSEILAWSQYLNANYEQLMSEVKARAVDTSSPDVAPSDAAPSAVAPSDAAPSAAAPSDAAPSAQ